VVVNVIIAALVIWSVTSDVFQLVLGLIVLAGCLGVVIVAAAAIALPLRRPELYRASPANVKFLEIPVLFIVAPLSIAIFVALAVISTQYPALVMNGSTPTWCCSTPIRSSLSITCTGSAGVVRGGRYLGPADLDALKEKVAAARSAR
jgi:hypothetical protein